MGSESVGQTGRSKKRRGDGRKESPRSAQSSSWSRRHLAGGWRSAEDGEKAEGTPGGGAGFTMARLAAASDARAGGRGRARRRLPPPLASRRVWLGVQLRPRWRLGARAPRPLGPHQGGSRRPPLLAPPCSARLCLRVRPPAGTPAPAPGLWPLPPRPQPICPALPQPCSSSAPPSAGLPDPDPRRPVPPKMPFSASA